MEHTLSHSVLSKYKSSYHPGLRVVSLVFSAVIGRDVIKENGEKNKRC